MRLYAERLQEGVDLKEAITNFTKSKQLTNATIISAVGSISKAHIRMPGATPSNQDIRTYEGIFEIVSLIGTIDKNGKSHLHISISDKEGKTIGEHLKEGCVVHTTTELIIASGNLEFERNIDNNTGFDKLTISQT